MNGLKNILGKTDIYLLDQILKNRYSPTDKILDAGCGNGRNMHWFYKNDYAIYGLDKDAKSIEYAQNLYPKIKENIAVSSLGNIPFNNCFFNHIISNAVLHFAKNTSHFETMFTELIRVLKVNGSLFIRMTSSIGIENLITKISDSVYTIPDGTIRYLLTKEQANHLIKTHQLSLLEPLKTVIVNDKRAMTTLVLKKLQ